MKSDLDAYVCLFEECDRAEELYKHSEQWLKHMRQHFLRWTCNAKSHGVQLFRSRYDYESHMREYHKGAFTEAQLSLLTERNARPMEPMFASCPFCGCDNSLAKGRLEDHIVGHLRYLALKSLPPMNDEGTEMSDNTTANSKGSIPRSRSTIKDDIESNIDSEHWPILENDDELQRPSALDDREIQNAGMRASDWGFLPSIQQPYGGLQSDSKLQSLFGTSRGEREGTAALVKRDSFDIMEGPKPEAVRLTAPSDTEDGFGQDLVGSKRQMTGKILIAIDFGKQNKIYSLDSIA